ncbi:hypothetical protein V1264_009950 [Littorina saxatilis]|uniref:Uncharacterized protein n=2 Tax=Littorina saxatilis TaxID=31220 RepID=A0AAN9G095_9CAEN
MSDFLWNSFDLLSDQCSQFGEVKTDLDYDYDNYSENRPGAHLQTQNTKQSNLGKSTPKKPVPKPSKPLHTTSVKPKASPHPQTPASKSLKALPSQPLNPSTTKSSKALPSQSLDPLKTASSKPLQSQSAKPSDSLKPSPTQIVKPSLPPKSHSKQTQRRPGNELDRKKTPSISNKQKATTVRERHSVSTSSHAKAASRKSEKGYTSSSNNKEDSVSNSRTTEFENRDAQETEDSNPDTGQTSSSEKDSSFNKVPLNPKGPPDTSFRSGRNEQDSVTHEKSSQRSSSSGNSVASSEIEATLDSNETSKFRPEENGDDRNTEERTVGLDRSVGIRQKGREKGKGVRTNATRQQLLKTSVQHDHENSPSSAKHDLQASVPESTSEPLAELPSTSVFLSVKPGTSKDATATDNGHKSPLLHMLTARVQTSVVSSSSGTRKTVQPTAPTPVSSSTKTNTYSVGGHFGAPKIVSEAKDIINTTKHQQSLDVRPTLSGRGLNLPTKPSSSESVSSTKNVTTEANSNANSYSLKSNSVPGTSDEEPKKEVTFNPPNVRPFTGVEEFEATKLTLAVETTAGVGSGNLQAITSPKGSSDNDNQDASRVTSNVTTTSATPFLSGKSTVDRHSLSSTNNRLQLKNTQTGYSDKMTSSTSSEPSGVHTGSPETSQRKNLPVSPYQEPPTQTPLDPQIETNEQTTSLGKTAETTRLQNSGSLNANTTEKENAFTETESWDLSHTDNPTTVSSMQQKTVLESKTRNTLNTSSEISIIEKDGVPPGSEGVEQNQSTEEEVDEGFGEQSKGSKIQLNTKPVGNTEDGRLYSSNQTSTKAITDENAVVDTKAQPNTQPTENIEERRQYTETQPSTKANPGTDGASGTKTRLNTQPADNNEERSQYIATNQTNTKSKSDAVSENTDVSMSQKKTQAKTDYVQKTTETQTKTNTADYLPPTNGLDVDAAIDPTTARTDNAITGSVSMNEPARSVHTDPNVNATPPTKPPSTRANKGLHTEADARENTGTTTKSRHTVDPKMAKTDAETSSTTKSDDNTKKLLSKIKPGAEEDSPEVESFTKITARLTEPKSKKNTITESWTPTYDGSQQPIPWGRDCSRPWEGWRFCTAIMLRAPPLGNSGNQCRSLQHYIVCLTELWSACREMPDFYTIPETVGYIVSVFGDKCPSYRIPPLLAKGN